MTATRFARKGQFSFSPPPPLPDPLPNPCEAAKAMIDVCQPLLEKVRQAPDEVEINLAFLRLQHQYHLRYELASKTHKNHIGTRHGHTCLHSVWRHFYVALRELLLSVNPPPLRPAPSPLPSAPVVHSIAGITLGEVMGA